MLHELAGSCLSSVEFVHDYIQFHFQGPSLSTFTLPSVKSVVGYLSAADDGHRDALCSQVGSEVEEVVPTREELTVRFAGSVAFIVSLRDEDTRGPEAIHYIAKDGTQIVV